MPIYFVYSGSNNPEDLRPLGISLYCKHWYAHSLGSSVIGVLYAETQSARKIIDSLAPGLTTLPGIGGAMLDKHIKHLSADFPKVKAGDSMRTFLVDLHATLQDVHFNPENF